MYKVVVILYFVCFFCYVLFTRVPDYFEGEFIKGTVTEAKFSEKERQPNLVVKYHVGSETLFYETNMWFLNKHKAGDKVTIIYDPSEPKRAFIYSFIGYWIKWSELFFTAIFFAILFLASVSITGKNADEDDDPQQKKMKYDL